MLILSRKAGQAIALPLQEVRIRVLRVRGTQVKLGIDAPQSVRVVRDECPANVPITADQDRQASDRDCQPT